MKFCLMFDTKAEMDAYVKAATQPFRPFEAMELDARIINTLQGTLGSIEKAKSLEDWELLKIPNFGRKSLDRFRSWQRRSEIHAQTCSAPAWMVD